MRRVSFVRACSFFLLILTLSLAPAHHSSAAVTPAKVKNFRLICRGDKTAFLAWDKAKNASYYLVYRYYDTPRKKYVKVRKTTGTNCRLRGFVVGKKYKYVVQSVYRSSKGTIRKSPYSDVLTVKGKAVNVSAVHARRWSVTVARGFQAKDIKTGKTVSIKAGTKAVTPKRAGATVTLSIEKGKKTITVKTSRNNVRIGNLALTKSYNYYSKEQSEAFVNEGGYTSRTEWLFWISQYTSSFHLFKGAKGEWQQVRSGPCVIGTEGHTVPGTFHLLKYGTASGKPQIYFSWNEDMQWGLSIHCRMDGNISGAHSSGCIRLGDSDLYFLRNNCPLGTTVLSY